MDFTMCDEFEFNLMNETTYDTLVCIVATCIIAVLIITPIKKRSNIFDHHIEETSYPLITDADHIVPHAVDTCKGTLIELMNNVPTDNIDSEAIKKFTGDLTIPARQVSTNTTTTQSPLEDAIIILTKSKTAKQSNGEYERAKPIVPAGQGVPPSGHTLLGDHRGALDTLCIPVKYKNAEIIISAATIDSDPIKKYSHDNVTVDKVMLKCHFVKSLLVPTNKYVAIFANIATWLIKIGYKGNIDLIIQQDNDIEFDQKAVNARQLIITTHIAALKAAYTVNHMYGVVTPKTKAK